MFLNCLSTKSGVTVGKVKAGILGGSGGVTEAAGGILLANSSPMDVKYLLKTLALHLGSVIILTFNKYTFRAGFIFTWQELF